MLLAVAPSAALSLLTATFSPVEAMVPEWTTEEAPRPRTPPRMTSFSVSCGVFIYLDLVGRSGESDKVGMSCSCFFQKRAAPSSSSSSFEKHSHLVPRSSFPPSAVVCFSGASRGRRLLLLLRWSGVGSCCSSSSSSSSTSSLLHRLCRCRDRRNRKLRRPHRRAFPPGPDRRAEGGGLEPPVVAEAQHRRRRDAVAVAVAVRGPARRLGVGGADALCRRCRSAIALASVGDMSRLFLALGHAREAASLAHVDLESGPGATPGRHCGRERAVSLSRERERK